MCNWYRFIPFISNQCSLKYIAGYFGVITIISKETFFRCIGLHWSASSVFQNSQYDYNSMQTKCMLLEVSSAKSISSRNRQTMLFLTGLDFFFLHMQKSLLSMAKKPFCEIRQTMHKERASKHHRRVTLTNELQRNMLCYIKEY